MQGSDFANKLRPAVPGGPVLEYERAKSCLPVEELSISLLGKEYLIRQTRILKLLESDPLFNKARQLNLSRPDRFKLILLRAKTLRRMFVKYKWSEDDFKMAEYLVDDIHPYILHSGMFTVTVREQASEEQIAKWLPRIENWDFVGCYAQTELGHGSNVRGLETTAKYDPETKEFIIHSPTVTASKWWNGGMGKLASHAIVVAQLLMPEGGSYKNYGVLPFFIQIRDLKTRKPLPGIVIGDIGPKYGYPGMDNGFMLFNEKRVPHDALLSKYSRINPKTNKFEASSNPTVAYGAMTYIRYLIIMQARLSLARATTIAIRYTSIRRQFENRDAPPDGRGTELPSASRETPVIDYPTVRIRLFPLLATTYALHYSGKSISEMYWQNRRNVDEKEDFSLLSELHLTTSGLKSLCTDLVVDGIETCRRALGGHGFSASSGFITLNNDYHSRPTVEGDNWMITQQVAKGLLKMAKTVVERPASLATSLTSDNLANYWKSKNIPSENVLLDNDMDIVRAFARRAACLTFRAYEAFELQKKPWNSLLLQFHQLSRAHTQYVLIHNYLEGIKLDFGESLQSPSGQVFLQLFRLFAYYTMSNEQREFHTTAGLNDGHFDWLDDQIIELMDAIRPHVVRLVDAWAIPDYLLDSALGRSDGKVYEDLYDRASRLNPMNGITINADYRIDEAELGSNDSQSIRGKL